MSKVQVDTIVDKDDISAPTLSKGAIVTGVCTATTFVGAVTGNVTGNADTATNAQGLTGSPNITVTDVNATGVTTTGIATVTTSVVVGSAVTANADGVITAGVGTFGSVVSGAISGSTGTFTGQLSVADKVQFTVASPQLEFNNGGPRLWSPSANTLTIHTGGGFDSASNERLRITSAGLVGVGTTIPTTLFDIQEGTTGLRFNRNNNTPELDFKSNTVDEAAKIRAAESLGGGILQFNTKTTGGVDTERIRIGSSGEIGIAGANYGTDGQVLTSKGSGAAVQWADAGGGQWTLLETATSTSNVSTIDTLGGANGLTQYSGTYKWFKIAFFFARYDTSNEDKIGLRISTDGSSYLTTNYRMEEFWGRGGSIDQWQSNNDSRYMFSSNLYRQNYMGEVTFYDPFNTTWKKCFDCRMTGWFVNGTSDHMQGGSSCTNYASNDAITGIQLFTDSSYGVPFEYSFYAR